jgi:hypothetical protein
MEASSAMPEQPSLIPVFVPALAELFAHAEKTKSGALTETEMHRIRDKGACIMMTPDMQSLRPLAFRRSLISLPSMNPSK